MKTILLSVVIVLDLFLNGCLSNTKEGKGDQTSTTDYVVLEKGFQCAIKVEKHQLITAKEDFENVWKENFSLSFQVPVIPEIDFSKKMVIAAWMGEKNTGGFEIDLQSINIDKEIMVITIKQIQPGKTCITTMAIEHPFIFAVTDKYPVEKTKIQIINKVKECN